MGSVSEGKGDAGHFVCVCCDASALVVVWRVCGWSFYLCEVLFRIAGHTRSLTVTPQKKGCSMNTQTHPVG